MNEEHFKYLEELRQSSGMTNQQVAEQSGVPVGTVSRVLSGQTRDPSFITLAGIVTALGGSLDALTGLPNEPTRPCRTEHPCEACAALASSRSSYQHAYEAITAQHEVELQRVKAYLSIKDKWLTRMFAYCVALTILFAVMMVVK